VDDLITASLLQTCNVVAGERVLLDQKLDFSTARLQSANRALRSHILFVLVRLLGKSTASACRTQRTLACLIIYHYRWLASLRTFFVHFDSERGELLALKLQIEIPVLPLLFRLELET